MQSFFGRLAQCLTTEPAFSTFRAHGKSGLFFLYFFYNSKYEVLIMKTKIAIALFFFSSATFAVGFGDVKEAERRQEAEMREKAYQDRYIDSPAAEHLVPDNIRESVREQNDAVREMERYDKDSDYGNR